MDVFSCLLRSLLVLLLTGFASYLSAQTKTLDCPTAPVEQASVNLQCLHISNQIELRGHWQLDFKAEQGNFHFQGLAPVPLRWMQLVGNESRLFRGKGVYRLSLSGGQNLPPLSLALPRIWAGREISILHTDGRVTTLLRAGDLDDRNNIHRAPVSEQLLSLPPLEDGAQLQISLGSYETRFAGLWQAPVIGINTELQRQFVARKSGAIAVSTTLLLFVGVILALRRIQIREQGMLALAFTATCLATRQINNSGVIYDLFPTLTSSTDAYISWLSFLFGVLAGFYYLFLRFQPRIPIWVASLPMGAALLHIGLVVTADLNTVQQFGNILRPLIALMAFVSFGYMIRHLANSSLDDLLTLGGFCLIVVALGFDIAYFHFSQSDLLVPMTSLAWIVFIGSQTYLFSRRYFDTLQQNALLNQELSELNQHLEQRILARTQELDAKNRELEILSRTDTLTGLANRWVVQEFVQQEFSRLKRQPSTLSAALLDVDFFKKVNDCHGHQAGDEVLKAVGKLLSESVREMDLVARWGGEEFCVIFPTINEQEAFQIMERIRTKLSTSPIKTSNGSVVEVTCSTGVASTDQPIPLERLMEEADRALYDAKKQGRNQTKLAQAL
jgi:diguanylate cyclase (GGDEF)-like protein